MRDFDLLAPLAPSTASPAVEASARAGARLSLFFIDAVPLDDAHDAHASFAVAHDDGAAVSADGRLATGPDTQVEPAQTCWAARTGPLVACIGEARPDGACVQARAWAQIEGDGLIISAQAQAGGSSATVRTSRAHAQATPAPMGVRVELSPRSVLTVHARAVVCASAPVPAGVRDDRAHASADLYIACEQAGQMARGNTASVQARVSSGGVWTECGWSAPNPQAAEERTLVASYANLGDTVLTLRIVTGVQADARSALCHAADGTGLSAALRELEQDLVEA